MIKKALPDIFLKNMENLFKEYNHFNEYDIFLKSFLDEPKRGIRMNSLKIHATDEVEAILNQMIIELDITSDIGSNQTEQIKSGCEIPGKLINNSKSGYNKTKDKVLHRIPWSDDGYYISNEFFPGRHFFYLSGLFYIQEPSAMLPAHVLDAKPGEHILDLCAAPGGKTAKIAADMKGEGILISNDINETRVKALVRNVELMGCTNCIVLNETPENIARRLPDYFDKILLDAPCSGEGMFRRDASAIESWEKFGNEACVKMQKDILSHVDCLLKSGGIMVYSTCTFSTKENEEMIQWFLHEYPWYDVLPIEKTDGVDSGFSHEAAILNTARIFPHHACGEGHFCAKLQKRNDCNEQGAIEENCKIEQDSDSIKLEIQEIGGNTISNISDKNTKATKRKKQPITDNIKTNSNNNTNKNIDKSIYKNTVTNNSLYKNTDKNNNLYKNANANFNYKTSLNQNDDRQFTKKDFIDSFLAFSKDVLTQECIDRVLKSCSMHLQIVQGHVYTLPESIPALDGIKISKKGLYLGEMKSAKSMIVFEPSHSFLLSRHQSELSNPISFSTKDPMLLKYCKGETIFYPQFDDENKPNYETGRYVAICVQGYPIGWGKGMQGNIIKNMYPQGWRKL